MSASRSIRRALIAGLLATVALSLLLPGLRPGAEGSSAVQSAGDIRVGQPAPAISAPDIRPGHPRVESASLLGAEGVRGAAVLFWATWCGGCRAELSRLERRLDELRREGIRTVLVGYREEPEAARAWLSERGLAGVDAAVVDQDAGLSRSFGAARKLDRDEAYSLPHTVVIDQEGTVRAILVGGRPGQVDRIREALSGDPI